jgi:hypothetical protein
MPGTLPLSSLVQPCRGDREFPLYYDNKDRGGMDRAPTLPHLQLSSVQRPSQLPSTMKQQICPSLLHHLIMEIVEGPHGMTIVKHPALFD